MKTIFIFGTWSRGCQEAWAEDVLISRVESDLRHMVLRFGHAAKEGAGEEKDRGSEADSAKGRAGDLG
jgi:hypothetical protein